MSRQTLLRCIAGLLAPVALCSLAIDPLSRSAAAQASGAAGQRAPTLTPKAAALIDLSGYWVSIVDEEWRWRMMTPAKGDYSFVPLNSEGRRMAATWDPAKDEAAGDQCKAYGAAAIMRLPERLHIAWTDDHTLEIDTDLGMQKRVFHFDGPKWDGGEPQWQGDSVASWEKQPQSRGFGIPTRGPAEAKSGSLKVVTMHMRPAYLRKNGVPYSGNAVLTEYFDRFELDGEPYLIVTGVVEDPQYLTGRFLTTEQFKFEPDASRWNPTACKIVPPAAPPVRTKGF
jgi:hypothetical protein